MTRNVQRPGCASLTLSEKEKGHQHDMAALGLRFLEFFWRIQEKSTPFLQLWLPKTRHRITQKAFPAYAGALRVEMLACMIQMQDAQFGSYLHEIVSWEAIWYARHRPSTWEMSTLRLASLSRTSQTMFPVCGQPYCLAVYSC